MKTIFFLHNLKISEKTFLFFEISKIYSDLFFKKFIKSKKNIFFLSKIQKKHSVFLKNLEKYSDFFLENFKI